MANPHYSECEETWENPAGQEERNYFQRIRNRRVSIGELATSAAVLLILAMTIFGGAETPVASGVKAGSSVSGFVLDACDDVVNGRGEC